MVVCDICGKEFENETSLRFHRKWHDEDYRKRKSEAARKYGKMKKTKKYKDRKTYLLPLENQMIQEAKKRAQTMHIHVSDALKELIAEERNTSSSEKRINSRDVDGLIDFLESQDVGDGTYRPFQIIGLPGCGKSTIVKALIQKTNGVGEDNAYKGKKYNFVIIDPSNEYDFLDECANIPEEITKSIRIVPNDNIMFADMAFKVTHANTILSKTWDDSVIFIIEEAQRVREEMKLLLMEARKRCKLIAVSPEKIIDDFPSIQISR